MDRFVLTDERLNCYGTRIITKGVDLKDFQKNPVMLFMHTRGLVIGKWEDIQVSKEDANVTALPVFDATDSFAAGIASKVEQKMLNACSSGLEIMEWSEKPEMLVAGQTRPTITKSILNEASIVDIPGNKNALRLNLGNGLWLSEDATANADTLNKFLPTLNLQTPNKRMEQVLKTLGLAASATEQEAVAAILKLTSDSTDAQADFIISLAEKAGLVTADNKARFVKLAKMEPALAAEFLDLSALTTKPAGTTTTTTTEPVKPAITLASVVAEVNKTNLELAGGQKAADGREAWTMRDWEKKDSKGLMALKAADQARYITLFTAQYGQAPKL